MWERSPVLGGSCRGSACPRRDARVMQSMSATIRGTAVPFFPAEKRAFNL